MSTATDFHDKIRAHIRKRLQALRTHMDLTKSLPNLRLLKESLSESDADKPRRPGEILK
jgi:hypothetical protein